MGQSMCIGDQPARSNTAASLINSRVCLEEALRGNTQSCVRSDNSSSYKKNKVSLRTKKAIEILQKYGPSSFIEEESTSCIYKTIVDDTFSWKDNHHNKWSQADSCNMPSVVIVVHESSEIIACGGEVTDQATSDRLCKQATALPTIQEEFQQVVLSNIASEGICIDLNDFVTIQHFQTGMLLDVAGLQPKSFARRWTIVLQPLATPDSTSKNHQAAKLLCDTSHYLALSQPSNQPSQVTLLEETHQPFVVEECNSIQWVIIPHNNDGHLRENSLISIVRPQTYQQLVITSTRSAGSSSETFQLTVIGDKNIEESSSPQTTIEQLWMINRAL